MAMSGTHRQRLVWMIGLGASALALARLLTSSDGEAGRLLAAQPVSTAAEARIEPPVRTLADPPSKVASAPEQRLQLKRLDALRAVAVGVDAAGPPGALFGSHSWRPPPPLPPPPPPPPPPRAPAFPYIYFGGITEAGVRTGFFIKAQKVVALVAGDKLESFQIDSINEREATVTYLPLGQKQQIALGSPP